MDDSGGEQSGVLGTMDRIFAAMEAERRKVRQATAKAIRGLEAECERQVGRIDRAEATLRNQGPATRQNPGSAKPRRGGRSRAKTPQQEVRERCEATHRLLTERLRPCSRREVCAALKISSHQASTALSRLCEEGRAIRSGTGRGTRYASKPSRSLNERIVELLADRGSSSEDELVQATGEPRERVRETCGRLIREEAIHMARREGRAVFVRRGRA